MTWQTTSPYVRQIGVFMMGLAGIGISVASVLLLLSSAVGTVLVAAGAFVVLVVLITVLVRLGLVAHTQHTAHTRTQPRRAMLTMLEPRQISTAHGELVQGWAVPLTNTDSYALVLTSDGYRMVNAQGQIVHRF